MLSYLADIRRRRIIYSLALLALVVGISWAAGPTAERPSDSIQADSPVSARGPANAAPITQTDSPYGVPDTVTLPNGTIVGHDVKHDLSPPLRDMKPAPERTGRWEGPENPRSSYTGPNVKVHDPVVQSWFSPWAPLVMPTPIQNFEGLGNFFGGWPPDTEGDVGPNHYMQFINDHLQIWNKSGVSVYGPVTGNTPWSGFGGPCQTRNDGDPIVLYDPMADRWLISQFTASNPYGECVAISQTSDPTGAYYRYFFQLSTTIFYDYPHLGVWPDGYYMAANRFNAASGSAAIAFDRSRMLQGLSAAYREFDPGVNTMMPAD